MTERNEENFFDRQMRECVIQDIIATSGHVLVYGPKGTGKTTLANQCAAPGQKITEVTFDGGEGNYTFWGQLIPEMDEHGKLKRLVFHDGPAKIAAQRGDLLIINEINHASDDIQDKMHFLADHWTVAKATNADGSVMQINPRFRIIATMNGMPMELREPVEDRFSIKIPVLLPSEAMLERLDADVRMLCIEKYEKADPVNGPDVSYRNCLNFCANRVALGSDQRAAFRTFGERDAAVAFNEALSMLKAKLDQQSEQMMRNLRNAIIGMIDRQAMAGVAANVGHALRAMAKVKLREEYERMLAEDPT